MWFLHTATATLHSFPSAVAACGYAILSHTWDAEGEQSFQDVQKIIADCEKKGTTPRQDPRLSQKIRNACILAEKDGYTWIWVDACCIDKTSSSELTESINSMFEWYAQAEVCYAYLADVPSDCVRLDAADSEFRKSRYHTRGWTLQELIAPSSVVFYSREWTSLGTRTQWSRLLQSITEIWWEVLEGTLKVWSVGIAARMYWASKRRTTRIEDQAYCLMGIFGVNMPVIYGEGRRAFQRLQLEIMKTTIDTSLFTWGAYLEEVTGYEVSAHTGEHGVPAWQSIQYLLARSPSDFVYHRTYYIPELLQPSQVYPAQVEHRRPAEALEAVESITEDPFARGELPRFAVTNYGMKCRFPVIESDGYTIAVLLCERGARHLGLLLHRSRYALDPTRPLYSTSAVVRTSEGDGTSTLRQARIVSLGSDLYDLKFLGKRVEASWKTIYITHSPNVEDSPEYPLLRLRLNHETMKFHIPHWLIGSLSALGFTAVDSRTEDSTSFNRIQFNNYEEGEHIYLGFGTCDRQEAPPSASSCRWATVHIDFRDNTPGAIIPDLGHNCDTDHVSDWPAQEKRFGNSQRGIRLSVLPNIGPRVSEQPLIHVDLTGSVYERMLREAKIAIPTREEIATRRRPALTTGRTPLSSSSSFHWRSWARSMKRRFGTH